MTFKQQLGKTLFPLLPFNGQSIRAFRFELNAAITRVLARVDPRARNKIRSINGLPGASLNFGSGGRGHSEWINIDVYRSHHDQSLALDIRQKLPLRDNLADRIFAEHVVEHLEFREDVPSFFQNCFRILKPGSWMRVVVPDGERWLKAYTSKDKTLWQELGMPELPDDMPTPMAMINHVFHQGGEHHFAYDYDTLHWVFAQAGFTEITHSQYSRSQDPRLAIDREEHAAYSLYVEARKPE